MISLIQYMDGVESLSKNKNKKTVWFNRVFFNGVLNNYIILY